jgi:hypothetical protein
MQKTKQHNMSNDTKNTTFHFPFETLTKIEGEPNNATITILKCQVYANVMENACTLGCRRLGYLGIIMLDADYCVKQVASIQGIHRANSQQHRRQ